MTEQTFTFTPAAGWEELPTENGRTLRKKGSTNSALKMSVDVNPLGKALVTQPPLRELAENLVRGYGGNITNSSDGAYPGGRYGRVVFNGKRLGHGEAWVLSDGTNMFMATYTSEKAPDRQELQDVANIISSLRYTA